LKSLRRLDPDHQELYRRQFVEFQELRHVYASPELLKSNVLRSLRVYFGAGLILVVVLSVLVAVLLSRRISLAYSANFAELMRHRTQMRYLQEISSWQEMAKMLAHEIKNPLTPIEILLSMVSIVNDGPPVPSDIADRIFDPYVSTKGDRDNMGLGLAIVRKIVIEHGGDIEYQEQGGHPCFLITLPRMAHA
jgi:nitrogen-specific signal transduction histidine kinase